jgi:hypothetical protein
VSAQHRIRLLQAELAKLRRASRTRADYDLRCEDCGAAHNLDTSIPSELWNRICRNPGAAEMGLSETEVLCTLCIDERLTKAGLTCDIAEFYFVGRALKSRLYAASTGDAEERDRLRAAIEIHRDQKADDRCHLDDQALYAALGDGDLGANRVGDPEAMLANCRRFIERRCAGGGWPTYADLKAALLRARAVMSRAADALESDADLDSRREAFELIQDAFEDVSEEESARVDEERRALVERKKGGGGA